MNDKPVYPNCTVVYELAGPSGNAFAVLGNMRAELRKNRVPKKKIDAIIAEATTGDYNNLLTVVSKYVYLKEG